jgi:hypothetical protein
MKTWTSCRVEWIETTICEVPKQIPRWYKIKENISRIIFIINKSTVCDSSALDAAFIRDSSVSAIEACRLGQDKIVHDITSQRDALIKSIKCRVENVNISRCAANAELVAARTSCECG